MGFYSPQSLVADARLHGVETRRPDLDHSGINADLEYLVDGQELTRPDRRPGLPDRPTTRRGALRPERPIHHQHPSPPAPITTSTHRRHGTYAVRLGLTDVRSISAKDAEKIVAERDTSGPYASMADLVRRSGITANRSTR